MLCFPSASVSNEGSYCVNRAPRDDFHLTAFPVLIALWQIRHMLMLFALRALMFDWLVW